MRTLVPILLAIALASGCASQQRRTAHQTAPVPAEWSNPVLSDAKNPTILLASAQEDDQAAPLLIDPLKQDTDSENKDSKASDAKKPDDMESDSAEEQEEPGDGDEKQASDSPPGEPGDDLPSLGPEALSLETVIDSVHMSFPLVEAVYREVDIANGKIIAAEGAWDTKLKAASENGPTGFYQTYRQKAGVVQPLFNGGEVFGGYRVGRGDFEPWYQERQTNDGGEFKVGGSMPFLRNRDIDERRAALWRANYDAQIAQPAIRTQLIGFTLDAALVYWKWVAEGRKYFAESDWLELAAERNEQVEKQVKRGALDPPELVDNERAIAKRKSKVADQLRKVQQAAVKLSIYLRDSSGTPVVPTLEQLPNFPTPRQLAESDLDAGVAMALSQRPDLQTLRLQQQQMQIDYQEANNSGLPQLDAYVAASQDVGAPTSSKRDKSEFELDAGLFFDFPLQQRKAIGKMQAIEAKIAQLNAKERLTVDKITAGVRAAFAGMQQAWDQAKEAAKARELANKMASIERRRFELGESDLLKVALREQYAIEAIEGEVSALFNYFVARSQYNAELAYDRQQPNP